MITTANTTIIFVLGKYFKITSELNYNKNVPLKYIMPQFFLWITSAVFLLSRFVLVGDEEKSFVPIFFV